MTVQIISRKSANFSFAVIFLLASIAPAYAQDDLKVRMGKIGRGPKASKLTEQEIEDQHLKLQEQFKSPKEMGRIYAHLSYSLASRTDRPNGDKIIKYAERALQQPLDVTEAVQANMLLGEGFNFKNRDAIGKAWTNSRKEIVTPYLRGLKIALDNLTERERKPAPGVNPYVCGGGEGCQKLEERYNKEVAEHARIDSQNELIDARDALIRNCIATYVARRKNAEPPDVAELERLAKKILSPTHDDVAQQIISEASKIIADREEREKMQREATKREQSTMPKSTRDAPKHIKQANPRTEAPH